ncbi:MAG: IS4 family transposase [Candidatus Competibacteraceae bacterium]
MERFLARFPIQRIDCLMADREFRGHQWLAYLIRRGIRFRLRIPNNTQTHNRQRNARLPVTRLFAVQIGETMVLNRPRRLWGHTLYLVGTRAPSGEHVIVITTHAPTTALADYTQRWETECLFAAMKRRGFNLEDTHITDPERLSRLVAVLTLALCWCYKVGVWLDRKKPIATKKHQRRVCSVVRLGLDTLRRALLNAASRAIQLQHMLRLLFDKTQITIISYGKNQPEPLFVPY